VNNFTTLKFFFLLSGLVVGGHTFKREEVGCLEFELRPLHINIKDESTNKLTTFKFFFCQVT